MKRRYLFGSLAALALIACGTASREPSSSDGVLKRVPTKPADTTGATNEASFPACSDAQIVQIAKVLNEAEIKENGIVARALPPEAQKLAQEILDDHTKLEKSLEKDVIEGAKITGANNAIAKGLQMDAAQELRHTQRLAATQGARAPAFGAMNPTLGQGPVAEHEASEQAQGKPRGADELTSWFIEHELMGHIKTLGILDSILIPNAKNAALKNALQETERVVRKHVAALVKAQTALEGACGGTIAEQAQGPSTCPGGAANEVDQTEEEKGEEGPND